MEKVWTYVDREQKGTERRRATTSFCDFNETDFEDIK